MQVGESEMCSPRPWLGRTVPSDACVEPVGEGARYGVPSGQDYTGPYGLVVRVGSVWAIGRRRIGVGLGDVRVETH